MTNRENAYKQAFQIKKDVLSQKERAYDAALAALSEGCPEYTELCNKISALGAEVALTALSGDTATLSRLQEEISRLQKARELILEKAGVKPISYDCPNCRDTGYINGKICDCIKQLAKGIALGTLSAQLPLTDCGFENFDLSLYPASRGEAFPKKRMTTIFKRCREYVLDFDPKKSESLIFMGDSGLGKTHLSLSIVKELLKKDFDVLYASAHNLFSRMENEHFNLRTEDTYNYAIGCDLLVIDDLGSEFVSPFTQSLLYNIINTRLLASKPVIISTNLTLGEIEEKYTPRVSSRLIGHYNVKCFLGDDIRQIKAMAK